MSSYKPKRISAYSKDLRWCMVYQQLGMGFTFKAIASSLGVDSSTVHRTVEILLSTGTVEEKKYDASNLNRKLTDDVKFFIMHVALDSPGIMLHEIQRKSMMPSAWMCQKVLFARLYIA